MARANTVTWLPLMRFAEILGYDPLHFCGVYTTLRVAGDCSDVLMQYAWQDGGAVSREDLALAIQDAERQMAAYLGYHLIPDWIASEEARSVRPRNPGVFNTYSRGPRGMLKSVMTRRAHIVSGGVKARTLIDDAAAIVRSDADGDGYTEKCTVTVTTTVDACEIRVFFAGKSGADEWEVRPVTVSKSGNTATITFKVWQVVDPDLHERLNATGIDGDTAANFETTVDVYRVYNDPQTQVQFLWEEPECGSCGGSGCTACQFASQTGCLTVRDNRLGSVSYRPATWDATNSDWDTDDWTECREPDRLRLSYYSGYRSPRVTCDYIQMDPDLERAVTYFAAALLGRDICSCENVSQYTEKWRQDLTKATSAAGASHSYNQPLAAQCPFGPWAGALYAWNVCNQDGRKVARW